MVTPVCIIKENNEMRTSYLRWLLLTISRVTPANISGRTPEDAANNSMYPAKLRRAYVGDNPLS